VVVLTATGVALPSMSSATVVGARPETTLRVDRSASLDLASPRPGTPAPAGPAHRRLPALYTGRIFAIGDSVMLGARRCIPPLGITADPLGNRQAYQGAAVLMRMRARLPHVVIVHLGTNAGIDDDAIDTIMKIIGPSRTVVWVTLQLRNDYTRYRYEDSSNLAIRQVLLRFRNVRVADWNAYTEVHRGLVGGDGIHLTRPGCTAYAHLLDTVARAA
jgi:hypothetical protein